MLSRRTRIWTFRTASGNTGRAIRLLLAVCLLVRIAALPQRLSAQSEAEEYRVKAAFIFHFAQLVEWPAGTMSGASQPIVFCMFDSEPRRAEVRDTVEGKIVGEHVLHVRILDGSTQPEGCNILFLSRHEPGRQQAFLQRLRTAPVLTIGETDNFISDGGIIRFHLEQNKVRFDVNLAAADQAHLRISSRLLLLATSVIGGGPRGGL